MINSSTDFIRDAVLGKGVYLTDVNPWESDYKIALNNWDDGIFRQYSTTMLASLCTPKTLIAIYDLQSTSHNIKKYYEEN